MINEPTREVVLYALTFLHSNMSEEVSEDMMDYVTPDVIAEDEIVSAIDSFSALNPTTNNNNNNNY